VETSYKTVLITGASSGIGAHAARYLASSGMHTILTARRKENLRAVVREIKSAGGSADYYPADLSDEAQRAGLFERIKKDHPIVDVLINNAGFGWYGFFHDMPREIARDLLAVNVDAITHLTSLFLPGMLARGSGHIINIGSIAGSLPNQGIAIYSASKAFLDVFTTSLHRELRGSGVHASVIRLGAIETEFYLRAREQKNGLPIPGERMTASVERVNRAIWRLLKRPRRVMYMPGYLRLAPPLFRLFAPIIDLAGPILLRCENRGK
jgi:short-subunit dehydrogenase